MITKGIRISDIQDEKCISLSCLLINILDSEQLNWALLWFDVTPKENEGRAISELTHKINHSENGLACDFTMLIKISEKIFQEIEILIIGCKDSNNLHRYKEDQEMYETCDIVMEMIDGGFWEVFSQNDVLIDHLSSQYKKVESITSEFQNSKFPPKES